MKILIAHRNYVCCFKLNYGKELRLSILCENLVIASTARFEVVRLIKNL